MGEPELTFPMLKEPKEWDRTSVTMPREVWSRLDTNLKAINASRPPPERYSRDSFMADLLEWALKNVEARRAKGGQV